MSRKMMKDENWSECSPNSTEFRSTAGRRRPNFSATACRLPLRLGSGAVGSSFGTREDRLERNKPLP